MAFFKFELKYLQAGIPVYNILWGQDVDPSFTLFGACERIHASAMNSYMSQLSDELVFVSVRGTPEDGIGEATFNSTGDNNGNGGLPTLPVNNAILVSKTFSATPQKGRMYLPGIPEASVDGGRTVLPARVAALQVQMDNFLDLCFTGQVGGAGDFMPGENVLLSRGPFGVPPATNPVMQIQQFTVRERVGSQSLRRNN